MTSSIVCGVDHSPNARAAARFAAALAERLGLRLRLVHVIPSPPFPPLRTSQPDAVFDRDEVRREAERQVAGLLTDVLGDVGATEATGCIEEGKPSERLAAVAGDEDAAFVVVGTQGEGAAQAALLGSVSIEMVQAAPCPVAAVPPATVDEDREPLAGARIVCGVGGPEDRVVVHGAARLAANLGLPLKIAHVAEPQDREVPGTTAHAIPLAAGPALADRPIAEAHALLAPMVIAARKIAPDVDEPALLAGDPAQQLAAFADELAAALLVVGTRGRGPIQSGLLGSVSRSLACSAKLPVVIDPLRSAPPG